MALRLVEANRAIQAVLARARDLALNISVSVCDADGHLVAHQRMDDTFTEAPRGSIGKAIASVISGRPSGDDSTEDLEYFRAATVIGGGAPLIRRRGGLPIIRAGQVEGALGVSGAHSNEQDEECALAGIGVLEKCNP